MLGLGSSVTKGGAGAKTIVTDSLVLKHNYNRSSVQPVSTGAASFNGTSDYINIGNAFNLGAVDFSMACWIWVSTKESQDFISKYEDSDNRWYLRTQGNGYVQFAAVDATSAACDHVTSTAVPENEWVHVAITNDRSDGSVGEKIYINGVMTNAGGAATTTDVTNTGDINIAKHSSSYGESNMCNVGIWSGVALTQAQVKSIMHKDYAGLSDSEKTNLVSWWNLDSVIDSADIKDGDTTVYDNHHGGSDTLGSELVTSYEVTESDTTGKWTTYGTSTLTSNNNILTSTIGGGDDDDNEGAKYDITSVAGYTAEKTYKVEADIWLGTYVPNPTNQFKIYLGGVQQAITLSTTQTTFTAYITTSDTTDLMIYQNDADDTEGTFFISNVSIKLVNGNTGTLS